MEEPAESGEALIPPPFAQFLGPFWVKEHSSDLRQWIPFSEARLIYEAKRGRGSGAAELELFGGDLQRLVDAIWNVAHEGRIYGGEPCWVWLGSTRTSR